MVFVGFAVAKIEKHSWQRVSTPTPFFFLLWRPTYVACFPAPFSNLVQPLVPSTLFFLLPCSFGWMCDHARYNVLHDMYLNLLNLNILVPAAPCSVFYAIRHQIYWRFYLDDMVLSDTLTDSGDWTATTRHWGTRKRSAKN